VAGERRLLAAREAGLKKVPCIVRRVDDEMLLPLALVENLQREDLNAVEEAEAFKILAEDYGLSHDAIAHAVAKSRTAVTNTLRLLDLAAPVLAMIEEGKLTAGQARPLLAVSPKSRQIALARRITREGLSAREAEALAAAAVKGDPAPGRRESPAQPYVDDLARRLEKLLGTKVVITGSGRRGSIKIQYFNKEDLNRLSDKLLNRSS
jgi:ParB family chromosome partitioning protein